VPDFADGSRISLASSGVCPAPYLPALVQFVHGPQLLCPYLLSSLMKALSDGSLTRTPERIYTRSYHNEAPARSLDSKTEPHGAGAVKEVSASRLCCSRRAVS